MVNALIDDQEKDISALLEMINVSVVNTETVYQMEALYTGICSDYGELGYDR